MLGAIWQQAPWRVQILILRADPHVARRCTSTSGITL
jgi:hypothetical protein